MIKAEFPFFFSFFLFLFFQPGMVFGTTVGTGKVYHGGGPTDISAQIKPTTSDCYQQTMPESGKVSYTLAILGSSWLSFLLSISAMIIMVVNRL